MEKHLFLPLNMKEAKKRGWDEIDFVLVSGDAYVDHPTFGTALIGRLLEQQGFRIGIIAQPNWRDKRAMSIFGTPRLGFMVSSGNIDSMVNHYTAAKRPRQQDVYSPGGQKGLRPDRAVDVYCQLIREVYAEIPLMIGGIEASLRRFAHYDYWSDQVYPSILASSGADLLTYGMSETQITYIAKGLARGWSIHHIRDVAGTCFLTSTLPKQLKDPIVLPSYEDVAKDPYLFAQAVRIEQEEQNPYVGKTLIQQHGDRYLVQCPPAKPLTEKEMDELYRLPFQRTHHPRYDSAGGIPALTEVQFSVTSHRGCYGGCNFCAIAFHQGRIIQSRSHESILGEIETLTHKKDFKGYIHDIGGPTANFRKMACKKQTRVGACKERQCLFPTPCPNLEVDHQDYLTLLRKARKMPKIKRVFVRSGLRFDYILADRNEAFLKELCQYHVSGQLKVAPEHVAPNALYYMGKPKRQVYDRFVKKYQETNAALGKEQYLVPYFISSHPGTTLDDAIALAEYLRDTNIRPQQVQDFIPTPGSLATAMYYSGYDPRTMKPVYTAKTVQEKSWQRALLQYFMPQNHQLVHEALIKAGRIDLIGHHRQALIRPYGGKKKSPAPTLVSKKRKKTKKIRQYP